MVSGAGSVNKSNADMGLEAEARANEVSNLMGGFKREWGVVSKLRFAGFFIIRWEVRSTSFFRLAVFNAVPERNFALPLKPGADAS